MSLLVASVFCHCERIADLVKLQRYWLDKTTDGYTHAVYLKRIRGDACRLFDDSIVVGLDHQRASSPSADHLAGLTALMDYAKAQPYDAYLFLDSDAWPVAMGWQDQLSKRMAGRGCAAVVRPENLDCFWHPSCVYVSGDAIAECEFAILTHRNLLGLTISDVTFVSSEGNVWPLMRSNGHSPHPILAGIYGDCFYHHGCGSRQLTGRGISKYRLWPSLDHQTIAAGLWDRLLDDPDAFTAGLIHRE